MMNLKSNTAGWILGLGAPWLLVLSPFVFANEKTDKGSFINVSESPPAGFEDLDKPSANLVDIYFRGRFLLAAPAMSSQDFITFKHPEGIVDKISDSLNPQKMVTLLRKKLPSNANKVCKKNNQKNCGRLSSDQTGVIFNADMHRIDLFFDQSLLKEQQVKKKFLPPSSADLSFVLPLSLAASGASNTDTLNYSLNGDVLLSLGNTHLQSRWNVSNNKSFQAQNLFIRHDEEGIEIRAGLFDTVGFGGGELTSNQLIAGARYASTTLTRTDRSIVSGSKLSVLLNSRSRVSILKDGRVLTSSKYNSGRQILDTSLLPNGSYDVVVRIQEASGETRDEKYFFSKSHLIPPTDQPLYFIVGGGIYSRQGDSPLPEKTKHWLARGGYFTRLNGNIGVKAIATVLKDQSILELGSVYLGENFKLNATALLTNTADYGYKLSGQTSWGKISLSASAKIIDVKNPILNVGVNNKIYRPINASSQDFSANLSFPIAESNLRLGYNVRKREDKGDAELITTKDWNAQFRYPFISNKKHHLNFVSKIQYRDDGKDTFIGLEYSFINSQWKHSAKMGVKQKESVRSKQRTQPIQLKSAWDGTDKANNTVDFTLFYDQGVQVDKSTLGVDLDYHFDVGRLSTSFDYQKNSSGNQDDFSRYSLNFNSNIAGDSEKIGWGGSGRGDSAIIIDIDSKGTLNESFEVYINNQKKGYAKTNQATLINVAPYKSYDIEIYPPVGSNYDYTISENNITIYPGNAKTIKLKVSKTHTIYGQAFDASGAPLKNALIKGSQLNEGTNQSGIFQAEVTTESKSIVFHSGGQQCTIKLPTLNIEKSVTSLGKVVCL